MANLAFRRDSDIRAWREEFPLLSRHPDLHYLDSAATTQKPGVVIDAMQTAYQTGYAPIHRGLYPLAEQASNDYENSRKRIAQFINTKHHNEIVFTKSATEALNLVAQGWGGSNLKPGDVVWVSEMEHHSNYLPWQRICQQTGAEFETIPVNDNGEPELSDDLFSGRSKVIALTSASNVLGTLNPISEIANRAKNQGILTVVDATQMVAHRPVDVQKLDCDFLAFSGHKLYGPNGIGVLYGRSELLKKTEPLLVGGGMVDWVGPESSEWTEIPARFEAGSPNLVGAVGLAAAIEFVDSCGWNEIQAHADGLLSYAKDQLLRIPEVSLFGHADGVDALPIISFSLDGVHPHDIAQVCGDHQVAIRAGHHCCQPLMQRFGVTSAARLSIAMYNTKADIDALANAVNETRDLFSGAGVQNEQ